ncbi:Protein of unknown function (DUF721) [Parelusimicrobium proximum]|uniref:DciA family protein n=1 Tax=Parelusimicrobium proximum TaxID=3228953 RepID=UPI003D17B6CD
MKFGHKPRKYPDLKSPVNPINRQLNRLMVLGNVWDKIVGVKGKFWVLKGVDRTRIVVEVTNASARHELKIRKDSLLREINKHFDTPWLTDISF